MGFFSQKHMLLFSHSVVSDSLQPHGLQHIRLPVLYYLLEFAQNHIHWIDDTIPVLGLVFNLKELTARVVSSEPECGGLKIFFPSPLVKKCSQVLTPHWNINLLKGRFEAWGSVSKEWASNYSWLGQEWRILWLLFPCLYPTSTPHSSTLLLSH